MPQQLRNETSTPEPTAEPAGHVEGTRPLCSFAPAALVHHAAEMVGLGRVPSLPYALLDLVLALVADLRVALLEIPSIAVVVSIELLVVGV